MSTYAKFASVYDKLMSDVPYERWIGYLKNVTEKHQFKGRRVLDLGCGTGTISLLLAKEGFDVTGVDLSEDMLAVARAKTEAYSIPFYLQNMTELELHKKFDLILAFCDVFNYLQTKEEILQTFKRIYEHLQEGGLLLFDVHSIYKMTEVFGNRTYAVNDDDVSYIWNCFNEGDLGVEHELSFFIQNERGLYERFDEVHVQKTLPPEEYRSLLKKAGLTILDLSADFGHSLPDEKSERIFFAVKKDLSSE